MPTNPLLTQGFFDDDVKRCTSDEVTEKYRKLIETSLTSSPDDCLVALKNLPGDLTALRIKAGMFLGYQTAAFGKDFISLPKLLELVVCPFLRLARQLNEDPSEAPSAEALKAQRDLRDAMLDGWTEGLDSLLTGDVLVPGGDNGGAPIVVPLTTAEQRESTLKTLLDTGFFKSLVDLLGAPKPKVGLSVMKVFQSLLMSKRKPGASAMEMPLPNEAICRMILKDEPSMTQLLTFIIGNSSTKPCRDWTDIEWVATRGRDVFYALFYSAPGWKWCINRNPRNMGSFCPVPRVVYKSSLPGMGCPAVIIDPEWDPKMQILQGSCEDLSPSRPYTAADMEAAIVRIMGLADGEISVTDQRPELPPMGYDMEKICNFCDATSETHPSGGSSFFPCPGCDAVMYCSQNCMAADRCRHSHICEQFAAYVKEFAAENQSA